MSERAFLFRLSHDLQNNAKVVEIGSWVGESSCLLAWGLRGSDAKLYAIDTFKGDASNSSARSRYQKRLYKMNTDNTKEVFDENIVHFHLESRVEAVVSNSLTAAKNFCEGSNSVDLIFIDGDHSEEATKNDIVAWLPFLRHEGIMVFHDFTSNHGVPQAIWWAIQQKIFSQLIGIYGTTIAFRVKGVATQSRGRSQP